MPLATTDVGDPESCLASKARQADRQPCLGIAARALAHLPSVQVCQKCDFIHGSASLICGGLQAARETAIGRWVAFAPYPIKPSEPAFRLRPGSPLAVKPPRRDTCRRRPRLQRPLETSLQ